MWVPGLQARRGLGVFSTKEGPSYLGLFFGSLDQEHARLSGVAEDGTELALEIRLSPPGQPAIAIESKSRGRGDEPAHFQQSDIANLAEQVSTLEFRALKNGKLENPSELVFTFTEPNQAELRGRGGRPGRPRAVFQHPSDGVLGTDIKDRYGDVREARRDGGVLELLRAIDPRIEDVEYLQTTRAQYFRAKLKDGRTFPLGMLGGGVVNAFHFAVNLAHVEDGFLAIDEVENGIYHRRLPDVFRALVKARKHFNTQLMLATHSFEALSAIIDAATTEDPDQFAVIHLRRDEQDVVHATVVPGPDAKSSLEHGYDLR